VTQGAAAGASKPGSGGGGAGYLVNRPIISGAPSPRQLSRQGSSIESSALHTHTLECAGGARLHQVQGGAPGSGAPGLGGQHQVQGHQAQEGQHQVWDGFTW
jgi:hypothetical protein